ncbi:FimB/Mfa2 family fimbrial subunit [Bacteroides sp.]|uniref:FimB/Mfa2 family fimbrial subunit n=1 Tax=Bacteroides sp. TaxID=29523 RepID=UPI00260B1261|nr:FimB/Mfa2 family fimbrial subunit [Bacteroides sp.]MDD3037380.1 FimB/Mfa2 family fimbrial subunit [Bacteroides sp.]
MKRISFHLVIAFILLLQGCIKDDLPECKSELLLSFRYTLNNQFANLFGSEVHRITVYIFDSQNKYVDYISEEGSQLTNDYVMHIPLPEGTYSVVAYGGDFNTYSAGELDRQMNSLNQTLRKGVTDINDFRAELKNIKGAEDYLYPIHTPDDLYVGLATHAVSAISNKDVTPVDLIKDTKKIKVKISGTNFINGPLDVYITALNGRYQFDNSIDSQHGIFKYTPINTILQPNYMETDLKMMRLVIGQRPMLVIKNSATSEIIYQENMIEQILLIPKYTSQEDIDRENEFVFEINLKSNENRIEITVSINGWKITNIIPDN